MTHLKAKRGNKICRIDNTGNIVDVLGIEIQTLEEENNFVEKTQLECDEWQAEHEV